jgi:hypothetical protein
MKLGWWSFSVGSLRFVRVVAAVAIDGPIKPRLKRHIRFLAASRAGHARTRLCRWFDRWLRVCAAALGCGALLPPLQSASFAADRRRVVVVAEIILVFGGERKDAAAVDANERGVGAHGGETIAKRGERECQENKICICLTSPSHAVRGDHALEGIGQPRAARIISLEQPAQQWYMRGSATEIER